MAKYLGASGREAGNACIDCHGGYGLPEEYDVERKFRECRLYKTGRSTTTRARYVGEPRASGMPRVIRNRGAAPLIVEDRGERRPPNVPPVTPL